MFGKTSPTRRRPRRTDRPRASRCRRRRAPLNFPDGSCSPEDRPALATGNSVRSSHPSWPPLTTLRLAELVTEAGIPNGVFNVIPGQPVRPRPSPRRVDMITFTGSTEVGRAFLRYSADSISRASCSSAAARAPRIVMADCRDQLDMVAADLAEAVLERRTELQRRSRICRARSSDKACHRVAREANSASSVTRPTTPPRSVPG